MPTSTDFNMTAADFSHKAHMHQAGVAADLRAAALRAARAGRQGLADQLLVQADAADKLTAEVAKLMNAAKRDGDQLPAPKFTKGKHGSSYTAKFKEGDQAYFLSISRNVYGYGWELGGWVKTASGSHRVDGNGRMNRQRFHYLADAKAAGQDFFASCTK